MLSLKMHPSLFPETEPEKRRQLDVALRAPLSDFLRKKNKVGTLFDSEKCPPEFLDALAKNFGVKYWDPFWPVDIKREFIKTSRELSMRAGTVWAMQKVIQIFAPGSMLLEWYNNNLTKGTARILLSNLKIDSKQFFLLIDSYKNVKTQFEIRQARSFACLVSIAATAKSYKGAFLFAETEKTYKSKIDLTLPAVAAAKKYFSL